MSHEIDLQLGRRLRRRRRLLGLTQEELGACCGVRFQQIQKYESAANKMSASMLARLAQALGVEAGYFYDGLVVVDRGPPSRRAIELNSRNSVACWSRAAQTPAPKPRAARASSPR